MAKGGKTYKHPCVNIDPFWTPKYGGDNSFTTGSPHVSNKVQVIGSDFDPDELQVALALSLSESGECCQSTGIKASAAVEGNLMGTVSESDMMEENIIQPIQDKNKKPNTIGFRRKNCEFPHLDPALTDSEDDDWDQLFDLATIISSPAGGSAWTTAVNSRITHDVPFAKPEETRRQLRNGNAGGGTRAILGGVDKNLILESAELEQDYQLYKAARNYSTRWKKRGRDNNGRGNGRDGNGRDCVRKYNGVLRSYGDLRSARRSASAHGAYPPEAVRHLA